MKERLFSNEAEEIDFFRITKAQFTSRIEYFVIVSEALISIPEEKLNAFTFWEDELNRFKRFCDKHKEFIRYYKKRKPVSG